MSKQKKYLFIENSSSYPYVCSNSEDVWNFIKSSNILTRQDMNECSVNQTTFIDLENFYTYPELDDLKTHVEKYISPVLDMLDCELIWIGNTMSLVEFKSKVENFISRQ